jgi:hypothetical protein
LDRNAIAQARLNGLEKDLGLKGSEYQTCISILFVGYVLLQVPSNVLISTNYVRPSTWMSGWMMIWGESDHWESGAKCTSYHIGLHSPHQELHWIVGLQTST